MNNSLKMEFGGAYDYIASTETNPSSSNSTGSRAAVRKETVPYYHSTGPSASPSDKRSSTTKAGQPGCSSVYYGDDVYETPIGQKFRVSTTRIMCIHVTNVLLIRTLQTTMKHRNHKMFLIQLGFMFPPW